MPFSSFEQFGEALCDTAGVAAPPLVPDDNGIVAFNLTLQDVIVNLVHLHSPGELNDEAFMLVTFGKLPQQKELEVLRLLAEANFSLLGSEAPVFGLSPVTDEVVLRQVVSLSRIHAPDAWAAIVRLAELARQWRINPLLSPLQADGVAVDPGQFA